jgi:Uma2 family endonuclease
MAASSPAEARLLTAEELLQLPTGIGQRYELVRGEIKTTPPAGYEHGDLALALGARLRTFVQQKGLGRVVGAETGFILRRNPDTVRAPDVAFVSRAREAAVGKVKGFFPGAPDLAVEVISPSEGAQDIDRKVEEYFDAGTQQVWIIFPETRRVVVYRSPHESVRYGTTGVIEGGDLLPGFACPGAELFE